jgi:hypothetical protein
MGMRSDGLPALSSLGMEVEVGIGPSVVSSRRCRSDAWAFATHQSAANVARMTRFRHTAFVRLGLRFRRPPLLGSFVRPVALHMWSSASACLNDEIKGRACGIRGWEGYRGRSMGGISRWLILVRELLARVCPCFSHTARPGDAPDPLVRSLGGWAVAQVLRRGREAYAADERVLGSPAFVEVLQRDSAARVVRSRWTPLSAACARP